MTSAAWSPNRLSPVSAIAARRYSSVVSRSGSIEWIRNGSMIVRKAILRSLSDSRLSGRGHDHQKRSSRACTSCPAPAAMPQVMPVMLSIASTNDFQSPQPVPR